MRLVDAVLIIINCIADAGLRQIHNIDDVLRLVRGYLHGRIALHAAGRAGDDIAIRCVQRIVMGNGSSKGALTGDAAVQFVGCRDAVLIVVDRIADVCPLCVHHVHHVQLAVHGDDHGRIAFHTTNGTVLIVSIGYMVAVAEEGGHLRAQRGIAPDIVHQGGGADGIPIEIDFVGIDALAVQHSQHILGGVRRYVAIAALQFARLIAVRALQIGHVYHGCAENAGVALTAQQVPIANRVPIIPDGI